MSKKLTISEQFEQVIELAKAGKPIPDGLIDFLEKRKESVDNKNSKRTMTKAQLVNEGLKNAIVAYLEDVGGKHTIGDFMKNVPELAAIPDITNQRVSALVRQLKEALIVVRTEEKGKAYFHLA